MNPDFLTELKKIYDTAEPALQARYADIVQMALRGYSEQEILATFVQPTPQGVLSGDEIVRLKLVDPLVPQKIEKPDVLSYGLEPAGYTARLSNKIISTEFMGDPKKRGGTLVTETKETIIDIPTKSSILVQTLETLNLPQGIGGWIFNKSSYTRSGIIGAFAAIEPGYKGQLTLCFYNSCNHAATLYVGEGICQIHFFGVNSKDTYKGQYQGGKV